MSLTSLTQRDNSHLFASSSCSSNKLSKLVEMEVFKVQKKTKHQTVFFLNFKSEYYSYCA